MKKRWIPVILLWVISHVSKKRREQAETLGFF